VFEPRTAHSMKSLQSGHFSKTAGSDDQGERGSMEHSLPRPRPQGVTVRRVRVSHRSVRPPGHPDGSRAQSASQRLAGSGLP
jgi:hypothetical protein